MRNTLKGPRSIADSNKKPSCSINRCTLYIFEHSSTIKLGVERVNQMPGWVCGIHHLGGQPTVRCMLPERKWARKFVKDREIHGENKLKDRKRAKDLMLKLSLYETIDQLPMANSMYW